MSKRHCIAASALLLALGTTRMIAAQAPTSTLAQVPTTTLAQMHHTAWTLRDGAPAEVFALAQTTDGYLWLGTSTGLFRFDGVEFERFVADDGASLPTQNISSLRAVADGSLWVGLRLGGVSKITGRRLQNYTQRDGLPTNTVYSLAHDSSGTIWAATRNGLYQHIGERWTRLNEKIGLPAGPANAVLVDRNGALWVTFENGGAFMREPGRTQFVHQMVEPGMAPLSGIAETSDGEIWVSSEGHDVTQVRGQSAGGGSHTKHAAADMTGLIAGDRESHLWFGTINGIERSTVGGDARSPRAAASAHFTHKDGLSGDFASSMLEDREGNVWIGTEGGIDRFRLNKLAKLELPAQFNAPAIVSGPGGEILVGNVFREMLRVDGRARPLPVRMPAVQTTFRDDVGTVWLGNENGRLWRSSGDSFVAERTPGGIAGSPIQAISLDKSDALWISVVQKGVFRRAANVWTKLDGADGLPVGPALTITSDGINGTWLGYTGNQIAHYANATSHVFTESDGVEVGSVTAIHVAGDHVWVGGESGLMQFVNGRFRLINGEGGVRFRGITGIVECTNGELWLNGAEGVTRIAAEELARARAESNYRVRYERFDSRDGLDGVAPQLRPIPSAIPGEDGTLWFTTSTGAFHIDPTHVKRNTVVPPVYIRSVLSDDRLYRAADTTLLPANTRALQVKYTALSLAIPDRVRFRYQLVSSDSGWQDAGTRRDAFYTNLKPGTYRFRVIASNDDALWNEVGAAVVLVIPPTFLQTSAFLYLCILASAALVWLAYRLRLRSVSRAMREKFDTRLTERTRIAQELHDTLLQGFTGITLKLQSVSHTLSLRDKAAADSIERILSEADMTLAEARHAVWDLRPSELESADLVDGLTSHARSAVRGSGVELIVSVEGNRRRLDTEIEVTALRIGREAVINALTHAAPNVITLDIRFDPHWLVVCVSDDGTGIGSADADVAAQRGHWGIAGMRERCARVGGTLAIVRLATGGTQVCATLPDCAPPTS
jgi:signal transduction histidine kinase/ligand-binding sensor domain-containing protein